MMGTSFSLRMAFSTTDASTRVSSTSITSWPFSERAILGSTVNRALENATAPECVAATQRSSSTQTFGSWASRPAFQALSVSACTPVGD